MAAGIYIIHNAKTGGIYVGQSQDIKGRWKQHTADLKKGRHASKRLQAAWDRCGAKQFSFKVMEYCDLAQLNDRERHFINIYIQKGECYNDPNAVPSVLRRTEPPPTNFELGHISIVKDYRPPKARVSDPLRMDTLHAIAQLKTLITSGGSKADMQKCFRQIQENAPKAAKFEDGYLQLAIATQLMHEFEKAQPLPYKAAA